MSQKNFSYENLMDAINTSITMREVLQKLNLKPHSGNYRRIKDHIKQLNVNIDHLLGRSWNKGKTYGFKVSTEDYLSNKHMVSSNMLKKRLFREKILEQQCLFCGLKEWLGKPITLELDHIDGDNTNNNLSNLRILCPNCHSTTDTYRGKNIKKLINRPSLDELLKSIEEIGCRGTAKKYKVSERTIRSWRIK